MKKIIFSIGIISLISKLFGFGRDISLSYFFGATNITDIFLISTAIPTVIFNFIALGITSSFIPMYIGIKEEKDIKTANIFTSNIINLFFILCIFICMGIFFFTEDIIKIFASGFDEESLKLCSYYTRISMFSIFGTVLISVLSGLLQVNNKFYFVALLGIPSNIVYILGTYIAYKYGDIFLPLTVLVAIFIQVFILIYLSYKIKFKYKFILNIKDKYLLEMLLLSVPIIISGGLEQINYLIDRTLASSVYPNGGITILNYANRLNLSFTSIIVVSLLSVLFPQIATLIAKKDFLKLSGSIEKNLIAITILAVPLTVGIIFYSDELVELIFKRGNFTNNDTKMTSICLKYYTISFFAIAIREIILKIFYALKATKTALFNSGIGIILNIILNIILAKYMGLPGIALATSFSIIATTILLAYSLNKYPFFNLFNFIKIFFKIIFATIIMLLFLILLENNLKINSLIIKLLIGGILGIISYGIILLFMKIKVIDDIKRKYLKL